MEHENNNRRIIDVTHISSRGSSYRITLPKKVVTQLNLSSEDDILVFFQEEPGKVYIEKLKR